MTNDKSTDIVIVLDRSGSMEAIREDTEGALNAFIRDQREATGDDEQARVTLAQFDDQYELVYEGVLIGSVPPAELRPRGMTALLDAMGKTITATGERLAAMEEADRPGHVIFVTITDGLENSSKEWTRERVFSMVKEQTDVYGWTFVFLAAGQDAVAVGGSLGISPATSMTYDTANVGVAVAATSATVTRARKGDTTGYTEAERSAAVSR